MTAPTSSLETPSTVVTGVIKPNTTTTVQSITSNIVDSQYKLNIFNAAGNLKPSVSVPVYQDMCRRNAEIIRSLSSTKWMTMDEILEKVWHLETKMRYPVNRTRKNVESAIKELIEREMVSVK